MSLLLDKGKCRLLHELEFINQKNNINLIKKSKKYSKQNSKVQKNYIITSPLRGSKSRKKATLLTTYQNNCCFPKNKQSKFKKNRKLNYNKSYEGNSAYEDVSISKDLDFSYTIPPNKSKKQKKLCNNSVLLKKTKQIYYINNPNAKSKNNSLVKTINIKSHFNVKNNENLLVEKLDEKFKSMENNIIDKKYENDLEHDEIIISSNRKDCIDNNLVKGPNHISFQISDILNDINSTYDSNENLFSKIFSDKNETNFDENYLLNTPFENNKNDFNIMYIPNYAQNISNDMLSLEIKLLIEKMIELQKSYHKELSIMLNQYNKDKNIFQMLIEQIQILNKKTYVLK